MGGDRMLSDRILEETITIDANGTIVKDDVPKAFSFSKVDKLKNFHGKFDKEILICINVPKGQIVL